MSRIDDFVKRLQCAIPVRMVVLFGSYASGQAREDSDIDVAVFSEAFEGKSAWERQEVIARATVGRGYRLSPIGFSMSEYENLDQDSFLSEILRTGRLVHPK